MEENVVMTEATTPEAEATTPATEAAETTPTETAAAEPTEGAAIEAEAEPFTLRYKHEDISVSRDEAKRLAQIGKHYEDHDKKLFDDLDYLATLKGKSVKDFVRELVEGDESDYREELVAQFGEDSDVVKDMLELRRQKNRKAYDEAVTNRNAAEKQAEEEAQKSATAKLAEQFEAVREILPAYDSVDKVPDTVIKAALKSGDLEKELLRFELSERNKTDAAKATSEKNKKENIGSVASDNTDDGLSSAFIKGVWG
jgi:hypothetical protein